MLPKTMTAIHFLGNKRISVDNVPTPDPSDTDVVVKVMSAAICGTDRENLVGKGQSTIPGHESAGEVVAVDRPSWIREGMRVAINCHVTCLKCEHCRLGDLFFCDDLKVIGIDRDGGFAEYVRVPEQSCMPLPDDISYDEGALLTDVLGTAYRAVSRAPVRAGSHIAIWGAGPIGLSVVVVAKRIGLKVAVSDLSDYRLAQARALDADLTVNATQTDSVVAMREWSNGGPDACFDCAGNEKTGQAALSAVKKRGTVVVVGVSHALTVNPWEDLICKEASIVGTRNFNTAQFNEMVALLRDGLRADEVITHRYHLEEAVEAFEVFQREECEKVVFVAKS